MRAVPLAVAALMLGGLVALTWGPETAFADNGPHQHQTSAVSDSCAGCHRAHRGVAEKLLVDTQPQICYNCHGSAATGATTDVQDGTLYAPPGGGPPPVRGSTVAGALRAGGFDNAWIDTADATMPSGDNTGLGQGGVVIGVAGTNQPTTSRHTNDGTSGTIWGNGALNSGPGVPYNLRCGSCHDPHGNGNYRILRSDPLDAGGPSVVVVDEGTTKHYATTDYLRPFSGLDAAPAGRNITNWCAQCHTRYIEGGVTDGTNDTGDGIFRYRHFTNTDSNNPGTAVCTNCHLSHGTPATMTGYAADVELPGQTIFSGSGTSVESRLLKMDNRGICLKCHDK